MCRVPLLSSKNKQLTLLVGKLECCGSRLAHLFEWIDQPHRPFTIGLPVLRGRCGCIVFKPTTRINSADGTAGSLVLGARPLLLPLLFRALDMRITNFADSWEVHLPQSTFLCTGLTPEGVSQCPKNSVSYIAHSHLEKPRLGTEKVPCWSIPHVVPNCCWTGCSHPDKSPRRQCHTRPSP